MNKEAKWLIDEKYNGLESEAFQADLKLLDSGVPLAYIIGNIPFYNCTIDLEYKPLIPRTETEYWVHEFVESELTKKSAEILDIFSGSGCIGIAVMKNSNANVDFAEIKNENIKQIEKNLKLNKLQADIFQSDVFKSIPEKKYDYILANPPYISKNRKLNVQESVLNHEDRLALFTENDGLFFIEKLIKESKKHLKNGGEVYIEYDSWQTEEIKKLLSHSEISNFKIIRDQYKKDRVVIFSYN
ncbi:MAG: release factor glutamine methyltransferase [Candidatus Paceibacteria bacterium]|jgi:release factor glutamine methyltransferase